MQANQIVLGQKKAFEKEFEVYKQKDNPTHTTKDPLTRYLRDRRLNLAIRYLTKNLSIDINQMKDWKLLVVCGGAGGEGIFFANLGFRNITNSDFAETALDVSKTLDSRLKTMLLNAENLEIPDESFDLVVVQDGLHHLSRPTLGFTEMLRVASRAVVVIEPHLGMISKIFGREWEDNEDVQNYVFRWNSNLLVQTTKSYLLKNVKHIKALCIWDHSLAILKIINKFPKSFRLKLAKILYALLNTFFKSSGNNMVGIVLKK